MYLRNIESWSCVTHHRVTDIDMGGFHGDYFTKFGEEALGTYIVIDNVIVANVIVPPNY